MVRTVGDYLLTQVNAPEQVIYRSARHILEMAFPVSDTVRVKREDLHKALNVTRLAARSRYSQNDADAVARLRASLNGGAQ